MSLRIIIAHNDSESENETLSFFDRMRDFLEKQYYIEKFESLYQEEKSKINKENSKYNFPDDISQNFLCPISYDVLYDPVITADGHTYEKIEILKWFINDNKTSPLTNKKLESLDVIPNIVLKNVINDWKKQYLK